MKRLMIASVAVGTMAMNAPIAHAAVVQSGCGFDSIAQATVTGGQDTFTGAAYGYAVFDDADPHTLRCYVTVDGSEQSSTSTSSGSVVVTAQGQITYNAADGQAVDLCTEIDGVTVECGAADTTTIPPPQVVEALDTVFGVLLTVATIVDDTLAPVFTAIDDVAGPDVDWLVCPIFMALAGTYEITTPFATIKILYIAPDGDVYPAGFPRTWDCPPYQN